MKLINFSEFKRNRIFNLLRLRPSFVIIGAQRSGTTSLYQYLTGHPGIKYAGKKEIHYYDTSYELGISWYLSLFPFFKIQYLKRIISGKKVISGEASPYYIMHPLVPDRIKKDFPSIKIIILLRNPVDRAFSHYNLMKKKGIETLSFNEAILNEEKRLLNEYNRIIDGENYYSFNYQNYSYLKRGIYAEQLHAWFQYFPQEQFYIIKSEEFFTNTSYYMAEIFNFLGMESYEAKDFKVFNKYSTESMDKDIREKLEEFYKPHNEKLSILLKRDFNW